MRATLLVEILTEELPPKSLRALSQAFLDKLVSGLKKAQLATSGEAKAYATPRRLAVLVPDVASEAPDRESELTGPSTKAPEQAVAGFARKAGVELGRLERRDTAKGEIYVARTKVKGAVLTDALAAMVEEALESLPIPKLMRWGTGEAQFVRPVHGVVLLHGERLISGKVLGIAASRDTAGHRFMGAAKISLKNADEYEQRLASEGMVMADFDARRAEIERQLGATAAREGGALGEHSDLLDEVTALVEHPSVYTGKFDAAFLEVPQECLTLTMRQNQKYFPLFDASGRLLPKFLIVSNMRVGDPRHIVGGNERVVRPRLEDARFFYNQDRKTRLESRVPELARVVYHNKLGSQLDRVQRIKALSKRIAETLKTDSEAAVRAAWLAKADLLTGMVGEFPELQGIMGRYYALHDGESRQVADAIEAHYRPRFAGDRLPEHLVSCAVALADKLDAMSGLFSVGQAPTGDKDPFGLRRAAFGIIRILAERRLPLSLRDYISDPALENFIYERARGYFLEQGYTANEIEAVLSLRPERIDLVPRRLEAVRAFSSLPEAESLAAANKRIGNILKQAGAARPEFDMALLVLAEEKALAKTFKQMHAGVEKAYSDLEYTGALKALASLKAPVDAFFDKVMVMDKDPRVRDNRIAFLGILHGTMNRIADLSKLAK
ncbi:MAG TPA: glycine--tRNA ligase subunit beta [Burkholderiales bacterium]|nr:glycine--tRNA ligase subunit beta [Burkholderiales bacterium]